MRHWLFIGSLIILGTVFVLRNKTHNRVLPATTRGITLDQLNAATSRAREVHAATQTATSGPIVGVPLDKVPSLSIAPTSGPSTSDGR